MTIFDKVDFIEIEPALIQGHKYTFIKKSLLVTGTFLCKVYAFYRAAFSISPFEQ